MRDKKILNKQVIKRKRKWHLDGIWKGISLVWSCVFKFSLLMLGLAVISLLFVSLYEYLLTTPYIRLEKVLVTGVDKETKRELLDMSGLDRDLSLLAINLRELKERLEVHPWVRSVDLEKRFPHTLIIRVEKEKPWALVAADGLRYVNRWGEVFKEAEPTGVLDYPIITGLEEGGSIEAEQLGCAMKVLRTLEHEKGPWSLEGLGEIHIREDGSVSLYFSAIPAVIKLKGVELEARMGDLKRLVEHLNSTGRIHMVRCINLNYSDGAVVSLKTG